MYSITDPSGGVTSFRIDSPPKPPAVPNPGYFAALRNGKPLPIGPWSREIIEHSAKPGVVSTTRSRKSYVWVTTRSLSGDCVAYLTTSYLGHEPITVPDSLESYLVNEAVNNVKNSEWDIGTFAAELNKTHDLLSNVKTRSLKRVGKILDRKIGRVRTLAEFADAWLEYRYGWRILMYDIESAAQSYESLKEKHLLKRYSAHESMIDVRYRHSNAFGGFGTDGGTNISLNALFGVPGGTDYVTNKKVDIRVGAGASVSEFLGSRAYTLNPLLTTWELVPFSFIVDWFIDIGAAVGASTPTFGRDLAYVWKSVRHEISIQSSWAIQAYKEDSSYTYVSDATGSGNTKRILYERTPITFQPMNLSFNPQLNLAKFTDLAAIFYNQQSRQLRRLRHG